MIILVCLFNVAIRKFKLLYGSLYCWRCPPKLRKCNALALSGAVSFIDKYYILSQQLQVEYGQSICLHPAQQRAAL